MKKILILFAVLFLGVPAHAATEVVDELADAKQSPAPRSDRPMNTSTRVSLNAVQAAFDAAPANGNVMTVTYDRAVTYKLRIREMMETLVVLPAGERIKDFVLGDKSNFNFVPLPERRSGKLGGKYPGADTNLIVVGDSGNVYSFYVRIDSIQSPYLPVLVVYVEDAADAALKPLRKAAADVVATMKAQPKAPAAAEAVGEFKDATKEDVEYLRRLASADPATLYFGYDTSGENALAPQRIFDDGHWTYFQFGAGNLDSVQQLPTVYRVVEGFDVPVNTRVVAGTLIAEALSSGWTLRSGGQHLCVRRKK